MMPKCKDLMIKPLPQHISGLPSPETNGLDLPKKGLLLPKDNFAGLPFLAIFRVQTLLVLGGYLITSFQNSLILKWIHSSWICWQRCSKKYSPKWRDLLVIYHGTLRKKSPTQNRSKPCKPTKSQVRTNPPPDFDDIFLQVFFSRFFSADFLR